MTNVCNLTTTGAINIHIQKYTRRSGLVQTKIKQQFYIKFSTKKFLQSKVSFNNGFYDFLNGCCCNRQFLLLAFGEPQNFNENRPSGLSEKFY